MQEGKDVGGLAKRYERRQLTIRDSDACVLNWRRLARRRARFSLDTHFHGVEDSE